MALEPKKFLEQLGLTPSEIAVYLSMVSGVHAARNLVKVTGLKRPTVYYALGCLEKRGLISKVERSGVNRFSLEPLEKLQVLADEKFQEASSLKERIQEAIPALQESFGLTDQKPTVAFFEGTDAVKRAIMEILYCRNKQINSVAPADNFFWQVGRDFVRLFVEERNKRGIKVKNLWETPIDQKILKQYYALSEVRILPQVMKGKFSSSIFLFDDKVLYVSSLKSSYCVLITSKEHHDTMQAWFDGLWGASKAHKK